MTTSRFRRDHARYPKSDHFNGKTFFNPTTSGQEDGFFPLFRYLAIRNRRPWPETVANLPEKLWLEPIPDGQVVVTFINHATVLLQFHGLNVLTDPIYSERAGPLSLIGSKRARSPGIAFDHLPKIDLVVFSHNHYDHLDVGTIRRIQAKFQPLFLAPLGDEPLLRSAGATHIQEMDWWEVKQIPLHGRVTFAPTQHFSARGPFDRNRTLWGSYYFEIGGVRIYFGGDTAYSVHFAEIKRRLGPPDLSLLPIGSYEPRSLMKGVHMNPADAVQAHLDLGSARSIGIHFGTFHMSDESIEQPVIDLESEKKRIRSEPEEFLVLKEGRPMLFSARTRDTTEGDAPYLHNVTPYQQIQR